MRRIRVAKDESHIWLMVAYLLILFFLYEWMVMYTVVINGCMSMEHNWLTENEAGISMFAIFIVVFVLFAGWILVEILAAHIVNYRDKWFCTCMGSFAILVVMATLTTFKIHWELYEVSWGERSPLEFSILLIDMQGWLKDREQYPSIIKSYCYFSDWVDPHIPK